MFNFVIVGMQISRIKRFTLESLDERHESVDEILLYYP